MHIKVTIELVLLSVWINLSEVNANNVKFCILSFISTNADKIKIIEYV